MMKWLVALTLSVFSPAIAAADSVCAHLFDYNQIRNGMSYQDVVRQLGCEGEVVSRAEVNGARSAMVQWYGGMINRSGYMYVVFVDGRVASKSQNGLR